MLALALVALALAGCPSLSTRQTAETLPPGTWQVGAAIDLVAANDERYDWRAGGPSVEVTVRRGLGENLDAGLKLHVLGIEAGAKWRFHRGTWTLAVAPALGLSRTKNEGLTTDAGFVFVHATGLASRPLSKRWTLTLGPKLLLDRFEPATSGVAYGLALGALVGVDFRWGERGRWHLVPELNLYRVVAGSEPVQGGMLQGGVALQLDF